MDIFMLGKTLNAILDSGVADKAVQLVTTVKKGADDEKTIDAYEDAFIKLIDENQKLKAVALGYKEEYEQIYLSEQDIEYLQKTATRLLNLFMPELTDEDKENLKLLYVNQGYNEVDANKLIKENEEKQREEIDNFKKIIDLIQVDTLRTMQLLGFNYREAIGEPLTEITANALRNLTNNSNNLETDNNSDDLSLD